MSKNIHPAIIKVIKEHAKEVNLVDAHTYYKGAQNSITSEDLEYLACMCPEIKTVVASFSDKEFIEALKKLPQLTKLSLIEIFAGPLFWKSFIGFKHLKHLRINEAYGISEYFFEMLEALPSLTSLEIIFSQTIYDNFLKSLENLKKLKSLYISNCPQVALEDFTEKSFLYVSKIKSLQFLSIYHSFETKAEGLKHLQFSPSLKTLLFSSIDLAEITPLADIKTLQNLIIKSSEITDENLKVISSFKNLKSLSLDECNQVSELGIQKLLCLPRLKHLKLRKAPLLTGKEFGSFKKLKTLRLDSFEQITDEGVHCLASLTQLKQLSILRSPLSCERKKTLYKKLPLTSLKFKK